MKTCLVMACGEKLANPTHDFCLKHWHMEREGRLHKGASGNWVEKYVPTKTEPTAAAKTELKPQVASKPDAKSGEDDFGPGFLSSTKLGTHFEVSGGRMNLILAELGWIEKYVKGWLPTEQGKNLGAEIREARPSGVPYVVWPKSILVNPVLMGSVKELLGEGVEEAKAVAEPVAAVAQAKGAEAEPSNDFRERFPARFRSTDGHFVRSRAEMLIDNWLYMQSIVHAFERKLPIEEEVYCDFYIPQKKVYIEYWGMENDPKYAARMVAKKAIYQRYNMNLIELNDDDIMNLDDVLPRRLLKFGIDCT